MTKAAKAILAFIVDYCQRHAHPVNAILHIFGVPMALYGLFLLFAGNPKLGASLIVLGYVCQYLGHKAQGNEVGEVTLIKNIWRRVSRQPLADKEGGH